MKTLFHSFGNLNTTVAIWGYTNQPCAAPCFSSFTAFNVFLQLRYQNSPCSPKPSLLFCLLLLSKTFLFMPLPTDFSEVGAR